MFANPTTLDDLAQFRDIIKTWLWSSPPSVDVLLMGRKVLLTIYVGGAAHHREWSIE